MDSNQNGQSGPSSTGIWRAVTGSPVGVGAVLVFLPSLALFSGMSYLESKRLVGLPLLAIFGIVILFGTLALVAMFFKNLDLEDRTQPLALPEGSIRAAIALSLIVLFAIIAIMLFQGMDGKPFKLERLTLEQRNALLVKPGLRIDEIDETCAAPPASDAVCADGDRRYGVVVRVSPGTESVDMAKQLLVLVGTLMTSVTSYYFAARSVSTTERNREAEADAAQARAASGAGGGVGSAAAGGVTGNAAAGGSVGSPVAGAAGSGADEHLDGCDVAINDPTPDDELPPARGGVAPLGG